MKIRYDREVDILLIELSDEKIDYAEEAGHMIIHFTKEHRPGARRGKNIGSQKLYACIPASKC